jgi:hypothetical protein
VVDKNKQLEEEKEAQFQLTCKRKLQVLELEELTLNVEEMSIDGKQVEGNLMEAEVRERLAEV